MRKLKNLLYLSSIPIFLVAFNFQDNPPSNWTQQLLPAIGGRQISGMTFTDSLSGFIITGDGTVGDTNYILKTSNGGDNWNIVYRVYRDLSTIKFLNSSTGYVCGGYNFSTPLLLKTTNAGENWFAITTVPPTLYFNGMEVLNSDTMWVVDKNSFDGGIYRTTNGGTNWTVQLTSGIYNPTNIYFYNKNLGFAANKQGGKLYRTTNAGENWIYMKNDQFSEMKFINDLTGWRSKDSRDSSFLKTTDGGLSWINISIPEGNQFIFPGILRFSLINKDTIWGCGTMYNYGGGRFRGIIYKTTNGGDTWGYQIPDTSYGITGGFYYIDFTDKNHGWAFSTTSGVRTVKGGDSLTIYTGVNQISSSTPDNYKLNQNYPNPFNPITNIKYSIKKSGFVTLKVFNIQGKEIAILVSQNQTAGEYQYSYESNNISTGVYFYTLEINNSKEKFIDTKKMILVK